MLENYELVQKGFRVLRPVMAHSAGREFSRVYGTDWRQEIQAALEGQGGFPASGDDGALLESLDVPDCLWLMDRRWEEVFRAKLPPVCRTWVKELAGVYRDLTGSGGRAFPMEGAERALDTMARLCEALDPEGASALWELSGELHSGPEEGVRAEKAPPARAAKKNEGVMTKVSGQQLPSWRDVMRPHPDVAEGRYRTAEFAADLAQVARGGGGGGISGPR